MNTKQIRIAAFMTQVEFADAIGVAANTVRSWEQGVFSPSLKAQKKIVEFCKKNGIEYDRK